LNWTASRQVTRDPLRRQATRTVPGNFSTPMCPVLRATQIPFSESKYLPSARTRRPARPTPQAGAHPPHTNRAPQTRTQPPQAWASRAQPLPLARLTLPTAYPISRYVVQLGNSCQSVSSPRRRGGGSRILRARPAPPPSRNPGSATGCVHVDCCKQ